MTPASSGPGGGFQVTRMAVPLASLFVTVTPWGGLLGAETMGNTVNHGHIYTVFMGALCALTPLHIVLLNS